MLTMRLEDVLADLRGEAAVLRAHGSKGQADSLERACDLVAKAMRDYLTWLDEGEAHTRSGRSVEWLRSRFADWEEQRMAEYRGRRRFYRRIIVPRRANLEAARAEAERDARRSA